MVVPIGDVPICASQSHKKIHSPLFLHGGHSAHPILYSHFFLTAEYKKIVNGSMYAIYSPVRECAQRTHKIKSDSSTLCHTRAISWHLCGTRSLSTALPNHDYSFEKSRGHLLYLRCSGRPLRGKMDTRALHCISTRRVHLHHNHWMVTGQSAFRTTAHQMTTNPQFEYIFVPMWNRNFRQLDSQFHGEIKLNGDRTFITSGAI